MNRTLLILLCLVVLGYGAFEARRLASGPKITVSSPKDGGSVSSSAVTIHGTAENIAFLTINDAPAFTDATGNFSLTFAPPVGYNVVTLAASDRFGRRTSRTVAFTRLNYCPA